MYRTRSALLVFSSLALAVLWHLSANAQETSNVETANVETANAKVRTLQQERVDVLQRAVELALEQYRAGALDFHSVYATQSDLLDAQLDIAKTREERIRVLRSQLKVAKESMAISEMRFDGGRTSKLEVYQAESAALRIEIQLLKLLRIDQSRKPQ